VVKVRHLHRLYETFRTLDLKRNPADRFVDLSADFGVPKQPRLL
jgi:hypothetical protein